MNLNYFATPSGRSHDPNLCCDPLFGNPWTWVFLSLKHFGHFLQRHFCHWNVSIIYLTVVSKLPITVFISLYFQTFWPKWHFFRTFRKRFGLWPKKTVLDYAHKTHVYTLFETLSNQTLWELHDIVKKITWKINALSKKLLFKNFIGESSAIKCALTNAA